ncbi:ribonucleases P/MRP protein subunit POP1 isoform X2 [Carica papaya]|uniref:ribonucleases P/MRP protein subunit POP1 isoform X2 n=1 Tax=Carica papaya TaxID=3649 RepID=UPI000B8CA82E|nr:ribonucleases P/MRP protein subunit POP1 isoform X2 [Carica papaya]
MASDGSNKRSQLSSILPPRRINVKIFAESRAPELESLHSTISNRLNNDFRSRRNKRRRTTAHDNKSAKIRHWKRRRVEVSGDRTNTEKDQKKLPRRIRRRIELRKNRESGFCTSGDGTKRLRTHVWHAKRFTMTKLWGFHLPLGLHGRAVLRWLKNGVLVHDASYYIAVQLEGPEDSIMSILGMVLVPSPMSQSEDISRSILSGVTYGSAMLHHVGSTLSQAIVPVTYMWRPSQIPSRADDGEGHDGLGPNESEKTEGHSCFRQLWVWIHASAFSEAFSALQCACDKQARESGTLVECFSLEGQLAKLEVTGAKAFELLQKTLHPVSCFSENPWAWKKCSLVKSEDDSQSMSSILPHNGEDISSCAILPITVKDPRTMPNKQPADITKLLDCVPDGEAKQDLVLPGISERNEELLFSSQSKPEKAITWSNDKNLWEARRGLSPPMEDIALCMEKHHQRLNFLSLDNPDSGMWKTSNEVQFSRSCPMLLLKNNAHMRSLTRWSIILPLNWVGVFWVTFVTHGAHVIGLREKRWVACELGLPYFPSDFPDCDAYSSFMAAEATATDQMAELRPPAKRSFRVPIPPPWNSVGVTFSKVSIAAQDTNLSHIKNVVDGSLLSELGSEKSNLTASGCHDSSSNKMVARTSTMLASFLSDIHCDHLLLFPQVPEGNTSILTCMKDENMLSRGQKRISQIHYDRKLCFLRVLLHAYKEGVFEDGAVVCAPCLGDISLWTSSSGSKGGGLTIPASAVRSYFKEQSSGEWELHIPEDPAVRESYRWPIGFITTGFVCGSKKPTAEAFCDAVLLAHLREEQWSSMSVKRRRREIYVLVRNLRSSAYRLALATIILEQQEGDFKCI